MMSSGVYHQADGWRITFEKINDNLFIHSTFDKFDMPTFREFMEKFKAFMIQAYFEGYDDVYTYTQDPRIVKLVGSAEEIGQDNPDLINLNMKVYKWVLA